MIHSLNWSIMTSHSDERDQSASKLASHKNIKFKNISFEELRKHSELKTNSRQNVKAKQRFQLRTIKREYFSLVLGQSVSTSNIEWFFPIAICTTFISWRYSFSIGVAEDLGSPMPWKKLFVEIQWTEVTTNLPYQFSVLRTSTPYNQAVIDGCRQNRVFGASNCVDLVRWKNPTHELGWMWLKFQNLTA